MKRVLIIILVVALVATSGGLVALATSGVFSRDKEATEAAPVDTTEYGGEVSNNELAPEGNFEEQQQTETAGVIYNENLSDDELLLEATKQTLTVDVTPEILKRYEDNYSLIFSRSSMPTMNKERTSAASKVGWGKEGQRMYDAVDLPFSKVEKGKKKYSDDDVQDMHEENLERHATNIIVGMMTIGGMKEMKLTDDTAVSTLNTDWVEPALDLYEKYGVGAFLTYHRKYWQKYGFELPSNNQSIAEWREKHPNAPEPTDEDLEYILDENGDYELFVTSEGENNWVDIRKKLLMWFDRLTVEGVETYSTWHYWYLNDTLNGNDVKAVMNTNKKKVETQPSLNYSIIVKYSNGKTREIFFGYNIYDNRLLIFERTAEPAGKSSSNTSSPNPSGKTQTPAPTGGTNTPTPTGGTNTGGTPNPGGHDDEEKPKPKTKKDDGKGSVQVGDGQQGGGEGQGGTGAPTGDQSKNDMQDAGGGSDQNQGHSNPETVTPETPSASDTGHTENSEGSGQNGQNAPADDGNSNTVENTNETQQDYGKEEQAEKNDDVDGGDGNMGDDNNSKEIAEPGV